MSDPSMEKAAYKKEKDKDYENATRVTPLIVGLFRKYGNKSSLPPSTITVDEMALDRKLPPNQDPPSQSEALHEMEMSSNDEDAQDEGAEMKMRSLMVGSFRDQKDKSSLSAITITIDETPSSNRQAQRRASSCSFEGSTATHPTVDLTLEAFHDEMNCSHDSISITEHNDLTMNETVEGETSDPDIIPMAECVIDIENQNQSERSIPRPALVTSITTGTLVDDVEIPVAAIVPEGKGFKMRSLRNKRINHVYLTSLLLIIISIVILLVVIVGNDNSYNDNNDHTSTTEVPGVLERRGINGISEETTALPASSALPETTTVPSAIGTTTANTTIPEQSREEKIRNTILDLSGDKVLNESTPQYQALKWIIYDDPQQLPHDHSMIMQRYVITVLYYQLNGSNWTNSTGYLTGEDECNWFGVSCNGRAVTALEMESNNLYGEIPNEIVELSSLGQLVLASNSLYGKIPPNMHKLVKLTTLNLRFNNLSGQIPPEIADMTKLKNLSLDNNKLSGQIPLSFGKLKKLKTLKLFRNSLSGTIPSELGKMRKLVFLSLSNNDLNGTIPPELGTMETLEVLSLFGNDLDGGIPEKLSKLTQLVNLRLSSNKLSGEIPARFGQLETLVSLHLYGNRLSGNVPASVCNLKLDELFIDCSKVGCSCCDYCGPDRKSDTNDTLTKAPINLVLETTASPESSAISETPAATTATGTTTTTTIDPVREENVRNTILDLTNDKALNESTPQYQALEWLLYIDTQQLPHDHPKIIQRYVLSLLYYQLNGSNWTNSAGYLTGRDECNWFGVSCYEQSVTALEMESNNLYGEIPNEVVELSSLRKLVLRDNSLQGKIPPNMHKLAKLVFLNLRSNNLSGQIPPEIGDMTRLMNLYLDNNKLSGQIPPSIGKLEELKRLKLFKNALSGSIPPEISQMKTLWFLGLANNDINGTIPPELGTMEALEELSLFGNNLVGGIPEELSKLKYLADLRLHRNELTGEIPASFGQLETLVSLHLQENDLRGNVPASVCNLMNLENFEGLYIDCPKVGCSCCKYCGP